MLSRPLCPSSFRRTAQTRWQTTPEGCSLPDGVGPAHRPLHQACPCLSTRKVARAGRVGNFRSGETMTCFKHKQIVGLTLVVIVVTAALVDLAQEFVTNDPLQYFAEAPAQLIWVAAIALTGGMAVWGLMRLSPSVRRRIQLLMLAFAATGVMAGGGWLAFHFFTSPPEIASNFPRTLSWKLVLDTAIVAGLLWFQFYRVCRSDSKPASASEDSNGRKNRT